MRIGVIGTGYVGLVAGAGFADFGNDVVCIDIDEQRIARLLRGDVPIHEPGLPAMVAENAAAGRLRFSTKFADATEDADVILLCVGTPPAADGRHGGGEVGGEPGRARRVPRSCRPPHGSALYRASGRRRRADRVSTRRVRPNSTCVKARRLDCVLLVDHPSLSGLDRLGHACFLEAMVASRGAPNPHQRRLTRSPG